MGFIILIICILIYFIPFFVGVRLKHPQSFAIGILNLFLGWTLIGWVVALVWACIEQSPADITSEAEEIKKLADLKTKGLITEEEFNKKKAQILGLE